MMTGDGGGPIFKRAGGKLLGIRGLLDQRAAVRPFLHTTTKAPYGEGILFFLCGRVVQCTSEGARKSVSASAPRGSPCRGLQEYATYG